MVFMSRIVQILTAEEAKLYRLLNDLVECDDFEFDSNEEIIEYIESRDEDIPCTGMKYADMKHNGIDFTLPESTETFEVLETIPHKEIPHPKLVTANHITSAEASGRIRIFKNVNSV